MRLSGGTQVQLPPPRPQSSRVIMLVAARLIPPLIVPACVQPGRRYRADPDLVRLAGAERDALCRHAHGGRRSWRSGAAVATTSGRHRPADFYMATLIKPMHHRRLRRRHGWSPKFIRVIVARPTAPPRPLRRNQAMLIAAADRLLPDESKTPPEYCGRTSAMSSSAWANLDYLLVSTSDA